MTTNVAKLAKIIKETALYEDYDFPMAITGMTGSGKSTLSIQLSKEISPHFDVEKNVIYTRKDLYEAVDYKLPRYSPIVADETINLFYNRNFMEREQIRLLQLLDTCRYRNLCLMLNIPSLWSLDVKVRQERLKMWVHIVKRGFGYVFVPDTNPFTADVWHRAENQRIFKWWNKGQVNMGRCLNFLDTIEFDELGADEEKAYLAVKHAKRTLQHEQEAAAKGQVDKPSSAFKKVLNRFYHEVSDVIRSEEDKQRVKLYLAERLKAVQNAKR